MLRLFLDYVAGRRIVMFSIIATPSSLDHTTGDCTGTGRRFSNLGVPYTKYFSDHFTRVDATRKRQKEQNSKQVVKRARAYKQDTIERQLLYENRTKEYASGLGLDIGNSATATTPARKRSKKGKKTQCRCGATTHLIVNSKECPYNKKNLLLMSVCGEIEGGGTSDVIPAEKM